VGVRDGIAEAGALAADIAGGSHSALSKTRVNRRLEPRRERLPERHGYTQMEGTVLSCRRQ
jgi:hypothetical protein